MTNRSSTNRILALLAVPLLLGVAAPATADWFGISVGGDDFAFSLGFGDWGPYGHAWNDPGWNVNYRVALAGYGQWVRVDGLGEVWYPAVAADWRPYTYGRWVYTSMGWTWVSYEPWGYFPHHYGEWALTGYGWVWVPGYTYRPAHVTWVGYGSHVGWYPCAPAGWSHAHRGFWRGYDRGFHDGVHQGYRRGYDDGYWDGWHDARYATYVPWDQFTSDNVAHAALDSRQVSRNLTRTNAKPLGTAPARAEVSRRTGREIAEVRVEQRQVQVDGRNVTVARPEGASRSVATHAGEAVQRALAPEAARQATDRRERALDASSKPTASRATAQVSSPTRNQARTISGDGSRASSSASTQGRTAASQRSPNGSTRSPAVVVSGSTASGRETAARPAARSASRVSSGRSAGTSGQPSAVQRQTSTQRSSGADPAPRHEATQVRSTAGSQRQQPSSVQVRAPQAGRTQASAPRRTTAERTTAAGSTQRRPSATAATAQTGASSRPQGAGGSSRVAAAGRSGQPAQDPSAARRQGPAERQAKPKPTKPERD